MIEFLKISLISTLITLAAACVMYYFTRYDFDFKEIYNEGLDLYRQKNYKAALAKFQFAITKFPHKFQAHYNAGLCKLKLKETEKAKNYFLAALELNPEDTDTIYNLGYIELYANNHKKAKEYFSSIANKLEEESDLSFNLGLIAMTEEDYDEAAKLIKKAITISPEKSIFKKYYQDVLEKQFQLSGDMDIMKEVLDLSLELLIVYPDDEDAIYRAAVAYAQMGDWVNSINYCERLFNQNPKSFKACSQYGLALFCKGEIQDAIEMYEKAIKINSEVPETYMNLFLAYDKIGDTENAIHLAEKVLKKFPKDPVRELAADFINRKKQEL